MVGYVHGEYHLPSWQYSLAGAISGVGARVVSQPFDVIKIRFQVFSKFHF